MFEAGSSHLERSSNEVAAVLASKDVRIRALSE